MITVISFYFVLLLLPSAVLAIVQNVTINSTGLGIEYIPQSAWTVSTDSHATGGSFVQSSAENATVIFNITTPSTMLFWHGFKPRTAARYSICIDCSNLEALGSVVTIQSGAQSDKPVVLFASKPLDNTTHSIILRNLRNPIEGVVGVISLDSFSFTAAVEVDPVTAPATSNSKLSIGGIVGVALGSVVLAGFFLALAKFCTRRYRRRQGADDHSTKSTKILRKLFLSPGIPWKQHKRTAGSESSPIIDAVWKSKPLAVPDELPVHNGQTRHAEATIRLDDTQRRQSGVPVITITSPSTSSTIASSYSTTHQGVSVPPSPFNRNVHETDKEERQSDPYASYAAAYAAFAGITNGNEDEEDSLTTDQQQQQHHIHQQRTALRDSSLLPLAQVQEQNLRSGKVPRNSMTMTPPRASPAPRDQLLLPPPPPSSFSGRGIREGKKKTRTLSDKIKRGTLPVPPESEDGALLLHVSENLTVVNDANVAKENVVSENEARRLSTVAIFSSDTSPPPSGLVRESNPLPSVPKENGAQIVPTAVAASISGQTHLAGASFWSSHGNISILQRPEDLEQSVAESSSDGVESTLQESERTQNRPQSLQTRSSASPINKGHRHSNPEDGSSSGSNSSRKWRAKIPSFTLNLSRMTLDTSNTHTACSSTFSITPSVSEFPMPPVKRTSSARNSSRSTRLSTTTNGSNGNTSAFTDLLASTPPSSSTVSGSRFVPTAGSRSRSHVEREKIPKSSLAASARPRRPTAPGVNVPRDASSGSGLSGSPLAPGASARRGSSRSPRGSKRKPQSPGSRRLSLPTRRNAFSSPSQNTESAQPRSTEPSQEQNAENGDDSSRQSMWSVATTGETAGLDTPFYGAMPVVGSPGAASLTSKNSRKQQPSASLLTLASTLTATDEEFAGDVQLVTATRLSVAPDLLRPVSVVQSVVRNSAVSLQADVTSSAGSSNGQWEMVVRNDRSRPQGMPTGLSISTDRNRYQAVNVPVSARTDLFDAGSLETSHMGESEAEPVIGFGSGMGMPWSPNFNWPASPALNLTSPLPAAPSAILSSKEQPPSRSDPSGMYDYPMSVSGSTVDAWNSGHIEPVPPYSRQSTLASDETSGWKDIIAGSVPAPQRKSGPNTGDSRYSTTSSTFFGGAEPTPHSPVTIPPIPSRPPPAPPAPTATPNDHKPMSPINTRQGWHARMSSSQFPVEKQLYSRQRQTGNVAVGGVKTIFAIPRSPATRPKLSLQRVEKYVERTGNRTPISRYNSPYSGYLSPPSSAEPLISKR